MLLDCAITSMYELPKQGKTYKKTENESTDKINLLLEEQALFLRKVGSVRIRLRGEGIRQN